MSQRGVAVYLSRINYSALESAELDKVIIDVVVNLQKGKTHSSRVVPILLT